MFWTYTLMLTFAFINWTTVLSMSGDRLVYPEKSGNVPLKVHTCKWSSFAWKQNPFSSPNAKGLPCDPNEDVLDGVMVEVYIWPEARVPKVLLQLNDSQQFALTHLVPHFLYVLWMQYYCFTLKKSQLTIVGNIKAPTTPHVHYAQELSEATMKSLQGLKIDTSQQNMYASMWHITSLSWKPIWRQESILVKQNSCYLFK